MSEPTTSAAPSAPSSAPAPAAGGTPSPDSTVTTPSSTPSIIGGGSSDSTPPTSPPTSTDVNPYQERFGSYVDSEGKFTDGLTDKLKGMGFDEGRINRMSRQGSIDDVFNALANSQDLLEKRDGTGERIPDPSNENAFNQWRDEKGIPRDPLDPKNGYNFNAGLPEDGSITPNDELAKAVAPLFQQANIPRDQANAIIETVNTSMASQVAAQQDTMFNEQKEREVKTYQDFKSKHGFDFEAKEAAVGRINQTYDLNAEDPHDRALMTHPKYLQMAVDLAAMSRTTSDTPETGGGNTGGSTPQAQAEAIMREHPNGAWKRDSALAGKVTALLNQAAAQKR